MHRMLILYQYGNILACPDEVVKGRGEECCEILRGCLHGGTAITDSRASRYGRVSLPAWSTGSHRAWYCSSLTCSIQSTDLPSSCSAMAMCVMPVVGVAPCQCFSPGAIQTMSPGRISSIGQPSRCAHPYPAVTM